MIPLSIYTSPASLRHDTGSGHPECSDRIAVLQDLFSERDWPVFPAPKAEIEWIARCHAIPYIEAIEAAIPEQGLAYADSDTVLSPSSWDAALRSAGAVCKAVEDIAAGRTLRAFCANRPPGHHAEPSRAMGFCIFNNIFVGALHAQSLGFEKVAIVDFDVHHGNGSDAMARLHDDVFFASTHQWPFWPGTGGPEEASQDHLLNIPLPAGTHGDQMLRVYREQVIPALSNFKPDLLMISAGFDAHTDDPLAGMKLLNTDFYNITKELVDFSNLICEGRIVSVLEGGYDLNALRNSVDAHIQALISAERMGP